MSATHPDIDTLLTEQPWLRTLARQLARDPNAAADLEQDTWLIALQRPPVDVGRTRGWLRAVAGRLARQSRRLERHRAEREHVASREESLASTADVVAHAELIKRVIDAALRLDEPFRETFLLRYVEGLAPIEISGRMEVPASTVRSRLTRALSRLRAELGEEDAPVLAVNPEARPMAVAPAGLKALLVGTCCLLVVVSAALVAWSAREGSDALANGAPADGMQLASTADLDGSQLGASRSAIGATQGAAVQSPLEGSILAPDGSAVAGAAIAVRLERSGPGQLATRDAQPASGAPAILFETRSDARGAFRVPARVVAKARAAGRRLVALSRAAGFMPADALSDGGAPFALQPEWSVLVRGVVRDARTGDVVPDVEVLYGIDRLRAVTDADGRFDYPGMPAWLDVPVGLHHPDYAIGKHSVDVVGPKPDTFELTLERGIAIDVRFSDQESGAAVPGVALYSAWDGFAYAPADADGRVQVRVLPGTQRLLGEVAGYANFQWRFDAREIGDGARIELPMESLVRACGTVVDEDGASVVGSRIFAYPVEKAPCRAVAGVPGDLLYTQRNERDRAWPPGPAPTDDKGRFEVHLVLSEGPWIVHTRGSQGKAEARLENAVGPLRLIVGPPGQATVRGRIVRAGEAFGAQLRLRLDGHDGPARNIDDEGRFRFRQVAGGEYPLTYDGAVLTQVAVPDGVDVFDIGDVETDALPLLTVRCRTADGEPLADTNVRLRGLGPGASVTPIWGYTDSSGQVRMCLPRAGRYYCTVDAALWHEELTVSQDRVITATVVEHRPRLLRLIDAESRRPVPSDFRLRHSFAWRRPGEQVYRYAVAEQRFDGVTAASMPPGPIELSVRAAWCGYRPLELGSTELAKAVGPEPLDVELRAGLSVDVSLDGGGSEPADVLGDRELFLVHTDEVTLVRTSMTADDRVRAEGSLTSVRFLEPLLELRKLDFSGLGGRARMIGLAPGTYTIVAFDADGSLSSIALEPREFTIVEGTDRVKLRLGR
ncbi:MAG: sigma-70 family RNA polymerase sigma factor [bacterium]|nr:sigma-70 family RNA polymerase sigma factor [bacterium]